MKGQRGAESFDALVSDALPALVREAAEVQGGAVYRAVMARVERPLLCQVLRLTGGNQLKAARLLGINRNTLRKRLRLLGLLPAPGMEGDGRG
ncbi:MAG TPA: helix-turn-helix domain-containing protein [Methylomirabilota bacterium]|nr:helix-turn-helix domain-containing protein [Methylomirabilota bacterium]